MRQQVTGTAGDPAFAVGRYPAAGDDTVQVGMMGHCRAPGVQHGGDAEFGAQAPGIGSDRSQGFGRGLEHEVVDHGLVVIGDIGDLGWDGEDGVVILDGQQVALPFGEPLFGGGAMTLRAMAVATRVVSDAQGCTSGVATEQFVAAQRGRAAVLDGRHHLQLTETEMAGMLTAIAIAPVSEDVADLESRSDHGRRSVGGDVEVI